MAMTTDNPALLGDTEHTPGATGGIATSLTVERAAYLALAAVALVVRLVDIGGWPLLESEASTALYAWRSLRDGAWRPDAYVPLLYDAHLALFALFEASDVAVRLLPAAAGSLMVLLPLLLRDVLGRAGALACACLLALSPSWVYYSRVADWPILAALSGSVFLIAAWRHRDTGSPREASIAAVALGIGLTTGPGILTVILGGLLLLLAGGWGSLRDALSGLWSRRFACLFAAAFLLAGTCFALNPDGVGASIDGLGRWFSALAPRQTGQRWWAYPVMAASYEWLPLALAAVGAVWGLTRRNSVDTGLALWALAALLMGTVLGHREPAWMLDLMLPVTVLAARGLDRLWNLAGGGLTPYDGVAVYVGMLLVAFGFLAVADYSFIGSDAWQGYALITVGVVFLAWLAYWMWDRRAAQRVGFLVVGLALAAVTVRGTAALAFETTRDPREPMVAESTSMGLRDLESWLRRIASHQVTDPRVFAVTYDAALDPLLGWYLRDYPTVRVPSITSGDLGGAALLGPALEEPDWPVGYVGTRFSLTETWDWATADVSRTGQLRWFLYRTPVGRPQAEQIELWVRPAVGE